MRSPHATGSRKPRAARGIHRLRRWSRRCVVQPNASRLKRSPWNQNFPDRLARAAMLDTRPTARWNHRPKQVIVSTQVSALIASRSRIGRKSGKVGAWSVRSDSTADGQGIVEQPLMAQRIELP